MTQVIFDHALRVRLKADTGSSEGTVHTQRVDVSDAASSSRHSQAGAQEPEEGESTVAPSESSSGDDNGKKAAKDSASKTEGRSGTSFG